MQKVDKLYQEGTQYKKCGVILTCIELKSFHIPDLLADIEVIERYDSLQSMIEEVKSKFGDRKLGIGSANLPSRDWIMTRNNITQNYFSRDGLLEITK
ncbi:hypothetical protein [Acinetobacter sp. LoGeW2-3]|uniref:hypothetical protein n=1 Tax=Acinetobacter sp. LoGeW2-3 TaxID=1808001 RepID=UPI001237858C|nr:hypothetical protein [Acinetobacter sp. LoGeW2-3]